MKQTPLSKLRDDPFIAYISPFAVYLLLGSVASWESLRAWFPLLYPVQIAATAAICLICRKRYPVPSAKGMVSAALFGVVGAVVWVALCSLEWEAALFDLLPGWMSIGGRVAYDPFQAISSPPGRWAFLAIRMTGLALVVPFMEEVFWRGFLSRYLISEQFHSVETGRFTPLSFSVVTVMFALVHPELLAAMVWGAGINLLLIRTKNLWACIVAHAATNLLLGAYIITTGAWHLW